MVFLDVYREGLTSGILICRDSSQTTFYIDTYSRSHEHMRNSAVSIQKDDQTGKRHQELSPLIANAEILPVTRLQDAPYRQHLPADLTDRLRD
jgi:hypothetical protein